MLLVASSVREESHLGFCGVEFQLPPFRPIDDLSGAVFEFSDDLTNVAHSQNPSHIFQEGDAYDSVDSILHPFYEPRSVNCEEDHRHWRTLWYLVLATVPDNHFESGSGSKPNRCQIGGPGRQ